MPDQMYSADRLLHSRRRMADGTHATVASGDMIDEIASRIAAIAERHGPESVALYIGTMTAHYPASAYFGVAWMKALGSPNIFSAATIDQPGKMIAAALAGTWEAGAPSFDESDTWIMLGGNPLISVLSTMPTQNPARRLKTALDRGMKLIVVDPRRTETASRAHIHLQIRPGEDAALLAAMIHVILAEKLEDAAFLASHASGLEDLRRAVALYHPDAAAARAGVDRDRIVEAARLFAHGKRGQAVGSTGANMSGHSTLVEYLCICLNSICGRHLREGDIVSNPGVLLPRAIPRAQARPPRPARNAGQRMSRRDLYGTVLGPPTSGLADEILAGKIRAVISLGGNPVMAWPDQQRVVRALRAVDLFIQFDIRMTPSARLADYVVASKIMLEVPTSSRTIEALELHGNHWSIAEPFGQYAPRLADPPEGSDLLEEWELFYETARKLGLALEIDRELPEINVRRAPASPAKIDMANKPTTEELLEMFAEGSRISLAEVKMHPNGALFPEEIRVAPADPSSAAKLDLGNAEMMTELANVIAGGPEEDDLADYPFRLISRRAAHLYNSSGLELAPLRRKGGTYNPAFMHPADMADAGLDSDQLISLVSQAGRIAAIVQPEPTLRRGVIAMTHAHGGLPEDGTDPRARGSNSGVLVNIDRDYDRFSGIPHMSNIPVRIARP